MSDLRFALLIASYETANTRRNFRRELDADLAEFVVTDGELPPDFDFDGVVITGSAASAYWDEEWIEDARAWVREAHDRGLPILGVCFGHQLLASALGGRVAAMNDDRAAPGGYEIGYREIERAERDTPLFEGIGERFTAFTTHGDAVVELPPGAEVLASNEYGVHAFRVGHAFGVQFHPEYDAETAAEVTRGKDFLGDERIEAVVAEITGENYAKACEAKRLFDNFTRYARRVRAGEVGEDAEMAVGD